MDDFEGKYKKDKNDCNTVACAIDDNYMVRGNEPDGDYDVSDRGTSGNRRDLSEQRQEEERDQGTNSCSETDPNGLEAGEPGSKLDAGKPRVAMVLKGFARALWEVSRVGTIGAIKYCDNGWQTVPNGIERYADAEMRHKLKSWMGLEIDEDTEMFHLAQEAWNSLAKLELFLRKREKKEWREICYDAYHPDGIAVGILMGADE